MAVAGKTQPALTSKSKEKWQGRGGLGRRHGEIELLLDTSADGVQMAIKDKAPIGNQLR
jgi:hypothetical protein